MLFNRKTYTKKIYIDGLHCKGCVKRVENVLSTIKGIKEYHVSLKENVATIISNKEISNDILSNAINDLGFSVINIE